MNDFSALTHPTSPRRMRRDVFSTVVGGNSLKELPQVLEQCDRCGSRTSLRHVIFTGAEFLCPKCAAAAAKAKDP